MAQRSVTRDVPQLDIRAEVVPSTLDAEKRTVQLTWTTGARVKRGGWFTAPYWEELSLNPKHVRMGRLQSGNAPLLDTHSSWDLRSVLGVVEDAKLEGKKGTATVRFARSPEGEAAFQLVADGIVRNVSVGYRVHKLVRIEDGDDKTPVMRAEDWEPHEISMVPIGADAGAVTRSGGGMTNPCEFIEEMRAMPDPVPENPTPTTTIAPAATPAPAPAPAPQPITGDGQQRAAVELERERVLGIQRVGKALKRSDAEMNEAIKNGTSLADYRVRAQDAFAEAETIQVDKRDPRIELVPGGDSRDKWLRGAGNWLIERSGVSGIVAEAARKRGEKVDLDPGEFRGEKLLDFAKACLERGGVKTKGMLARDLVGQAFTQRSTGGLATTGDFPVLLENVLHKVMLAMYEVTPDKWSRFCSRGSVSDFKPHKRYRVGSFGALSALNEAGEFTNKAIPDGERQTQQAGTKGNIIGITRQAIINDDLSAFSTLATALGRAAKLSVEVDVFALLALNAGLGPVMTDTKTLFHADHGNIGTAATLAAAALDVDRQFMGLQRDPSGNELLELRPAILLVPIALGGQARVINDSQYDPDTLANKAQMKANIAGKMFNDIIDTGRITGTRRYLFADPNIAPVIEVAFLDGQDLPFMEMKEGFRLDGIEWRARLDYGVAALDYRGAVTNAGAP